MQLTGIFARMYVSIQEEAHQELAATEAVNAADAEQQADLQMQRAAAEKRCSEVEVGGGVTSDMLGPQCLQDCARGFGLQMAILYQLLCCPSGAKGEC